MKLHNEYNVQSHLEWLGSAGNNQINKCLHEIIYSVSLEEIDFIIQASTTLFVTEHEDEL